MRSVCAPQAGAKGEAERLAPREPCFVRKGVFCEKVGAHRVTLEARRFLTDAIRLNDGHRRDAGAITPLVLFTVSCGPKETVHTHPSTS